MENKFRLLTVKDIDCRIGTQKKDKDGNITGVSILLYKNARVDMAILDEVYGAMNWQRTHQFKDGKLYCTVSIYDKEKNTWIAKEDVGVESFSDAYKGQASDSFKRACVNWGIGRELYTAPFIWINAQNNENIKYTKFNVTDIAYNADNEIVKLTIADGNGAIRWTTEKNTQQPQQRQQAAPQPVQNEMIAKRKEVTDFLNGLPDDSCQQWINYFHIDDITKMNDAKIVEVWNYMHQKK